MTMFAYTGSRTTRERNARGTGINVYAVAASGAWSHVQTMGDLVNPSFLVVSADGRHLYCVHGDQSEASAFKRDPQSGRLEFLNTRSTQGMNPVHLALDRTGRFVVIANYASSSLVVLPVDEDGSLGPVRQKVELAAPPGPHPTEQSAPHPHHVVFDTTGRFVFVPDKGADRVHCFRWKAEGALVPNNPAWVAAKAGAAPRHLDFHPRLGMAYTVNELDSTVTAYSMHRENGALEPMQVLSTLPPAENSEELANTGAEIAVAGLGRFVYTSNRGHDTIATFAVDGDGRLEAIAWTSTNGRGPRFFALDPQGTSLYAANELTDSIVAFDVETSSGRLEPSGRVVVTGSPVCIAFAGHSTPRRNT